MCVRIYVLCVCVCVCGCACLRVSMHVCVCVCIICVFVCVHAYVRISIACGIHVHIYHLLQDGTWAASPTVSGNRNLIISPCPAGYCKCDGLPELTRSGCALNFSESICVDDRKGICY